MKIYGNITMIKLESSGDFDLSSSKQAPTWTVHKATIQPARRTKERRSQRSRKLTYACIK